MNPETKRRKYGEKYALWLRNYQRQRARALTRLAQENPDRYQEILEEERLRDEAEGKTWLDLSGRTARTMDSTGAPNGTSSVPVRQTSSNQQSEGDNGGEA
jgi:hypothetical protein